jgi:hypothetical protein
MFTRAFFALAGLALAIAATLQSADASPTKAETARCMHTALAENGLTLRSARRLPVGKELRINDFRVALARGDTVWGLCSVMERVTVAGKAVEEQAPAAALPLPSSPPAEAAEDTHAKEKAAAALEAAEQELTELKGAKQSAETRATTLETDLKSWKGAAIGLGIALLVALIAFAVALALIIRNKRARAAKGAQTPPNAGADEKLDPIPFTLARDAVTLERESTDLTFHLRPCWISRTRMGEPWEMQCELPWGTRVAYAPDLIVWLLRSPAARQFFGKRGIALKEDPEVPLLRDPLPTSITLPLAIDEETRQEAA